MWVTPLPSGRYQGGFRHPILKTRAGKPRKITATFDHEYEAEAWATTEETKAGQMAGGMVSPGSLPTQPGHPGTGPEARWLGPTLSEQAAAYLNRRRGELATQTINKYGSLANGLAIDVAGQTGVIGEHHVGKITKKILQQWRTDSLAAGHTRSNVNARLDHIRRIMRDLIDDEDCPLHIDPTAKIKKLSTAENRRYIVEADEEAKLLAAAEQVGGLQFRTAVLTGLDAGLRWQEVYALTAGALENGGDYLRVIDALEKGNPEPRPFTKGVGANTDGHRQRVVATTVELKAALLALAAGKRRDELLFPAPNGGVWDYNNHRNRQWIPALALIGSAERVEKPTNRIRKRGPLAGTPVMQTRWEPAYGFHTLRHTYGTRLSRKGTPWDEIATLMGHADERTTKGYIHSGTDGRRLALVRKALARDGVDKAA